VLSIGIAGVARNRAPDLALRWSPGDARALVNKAFADAGKPKSQRQARQMANASVARDATLPQAFVTLGLLEEVATPRARRLVGHAEELSRRDLPTQLWLIEDFVRRNDIAGALRHYDVALRTSKRAEEILYPVLASAITDTSIRDELVRSLAKRPAWRRNFILYAVEKSPDPSAVADLFFAAASAKQPLDGDAAVLLVSRLVSGGNPTAAWRLYRATIGARDRELLVRNGGFERQPDGTSFDWLLADEYDVWAKRSGAPSGGLRLELGSAGGAGGSVARQLLTLSPGNYQLNLRAGAVEGQSPAEIYAALTCAPGGVQIQQTVVPIEKQAGSVVTLNFSVPRDKCPAQWLIFKMRGDEEPVERSGWIDAIDIRQGGPSASIKGGKV
jgi:hypothetical protein